VIGVGTGPLMLMRAAECAADGARVLLLDRAESLGGAWRGARFAGLANVELGVHLIENRPGVAEALVAASGVRLIDETPGLNFGLWRGRQIPFGAARFALHGLVGAKAALRGDPAKARRMAVSARRALAHHRRPFAYPEGGMGTVLAALRDGIEAAGGRVELGRSVDAVGFGTGAARVRLADRTLTAERVLFASRAHAPVLDPGVPQLVTRPSETHCAVLAFRGASRPFAYVEVFGDRSVKRLRDVGRIASPSGTRDRRVICAQFRAAPDGPPDRLADHVAAHLARLGLADTGIRPMAARRDSFAFRTATRASLDALARHVSPRLEIVHSTDLAEDLMTRLARENLSRGSSGSL